MFNYSKQFNIVSVNYHIETCEDESDNIYPCGNHEPPFSL